MKILTIFIDMLRSEQVYTREEGWKNSALQEFFLNIGGTLFSRCYTPAPDSYRSFACFWSSQYPAKNGCFCRSMKTYDYLKAPEETFLGKLKVKGYQFNSFVGAWNNDKIGFLPAVYDPLKDRLSTGKFLSEFLKEIKIEDNSYTFINLEDMHFILEDEWTTDRAFTHGVQKIIDLMKIIFEIVNKDEFDEIIFFSDHGFRYYGEGDGYLLDRRRSNIFLFWHHKGEVDICVDHNLRSIMDVYPTLLNHCGIAFCESGIEGKDLFRTEGHDFLLFEEHSGYYSSFLDPICQWAVVDKGGQFYFVDETLSWKEKKDFAERGFYEDQLSDKMTNFGELKMQISLQNEYKSMKTDVYMVDFFSDGELREKKNITLKDRIKRRLKRG